MGQHTAQSNVKREMNQVKQSNSNTQSNVQNVYTYKRKAVKRFIPNGMLCKMAYNNRKWFIFCSQYLAENGKTSLETNHADKNSLNYNIGIDTLFALGCVHKAICYGMKISGEIHERNKSTAWKRESDSRAAIVLLAIRVCVCVHARGGASLSPCIFIFKSVGIFIQNDYVNL